MGEEEGTTEIDAGQEVVGEEIKPRPHTTGEEVEAAAPFGMPHTSVDNAGDEAESVEAVVNTVKLLFKAFSTSDAQMFSGLVDPDARFVRTAYDDEGSPDVTSYNKEYFVSTLKKTPKGMLKEKVTQPFVQTRDNLGHVWCRYSLAVNGEVKYTGVKSIQLRRTVQGWKIVNVVDTVDP
mmetsp:Transcript_20989/g.52772  ORF Transcript_20989/g.52772 Transcript_20989/m.52772 type:complete len:179 (+) Transcript_20989:19-555(+)